MPDARADGYSATHLHQPAVAAARYSEDILKQVRRWPRMMDDNPDLEVYDEPSSVDADDGAVRQKGPDAVDVWMTPGAAEETSERLLQGAMKARGQHYLKDDQP